MDMKKKQPFFHVRVFDTVMCVLNNDNVVLWETRSYNELAEMLVYLCEDRKRIDISELPKEFKSLLDYYYSLN